MEIEKVFVKSNDVATITCPECNFVKNIQAAKYHHIKKPLKIRCRCGHVFGISLDFRQHFRKPVSLSGTYSLRPPASGAGLMSVRNISRSGVGFTVQGRHSITPGQRARIKFTLSNAKQTRLDKKVAVISVNQNFIGCTFLEDQAYDKELGFFLRF